MNRYILTALYVMAGCAVAVPLKARGNGEAFRGEACWPVVADAVKVIAAHGEKERQEQHWGRLSPEVCRFSGSAFCITGFSFRRGVPVCRISLGRSGCKIRAPGLD